MSLETLVVCVAAELLQYYEQTTNAVFYGVASGTNDVVTNNFSTPLRISGGRPHMIRNVYRDLSAMASEVIGYLTNNSASSHFARLTLQICKLNACVGIDNSGYMPSMGMYLSGAMYTPLSKYFAMKNGAGPCPYGVSHSPLSFSSHVPPPDNSAYIVADGDGVLLVSNGNAQLAVPSVELQGSTLMYTSFMRGIYNDYAHEDTDQATMSALRMTVNGSVGPIPPVGVLDFDNSGQLLIFLAL